MELWIRSQDRTKIERCVSINYIKFVIDKETSTEVHNIYINHNPFGNYESEERALEVLDEIQDRLTVRHQDGPSAEFIVINEIVPIIYEMPKE